MEDGKLRHTAQPAYAECVIAAGGVPVYLPPTQKPSVIAHYVKMLDGLLLSGGADLPPDAYGEEPAPETCPMLPERYEFERRLIELWLQTDKPLFGICLGCQFVNVIRGGSLIQHIPRQVGTSSMHTLGNQDSWHEVRIKPGSRLSTILRHKEAAPVNSAHHQAVLNPGVELHPVAYSPDGLIEALEDESDVFRILVQWHPERMNNTDVQRQLFSALVRAARAGMRDEKTEMGLAQHKK